MIEDLGKLTMAQYVDLACGDMSVLGTDATLIPIKAAIVRRKLIFDYMKLSDPTGYAAFINRKRSGNKDNSTLLLFKVCQNLVALNAVEDVRGILIEYGISAKTMTAQQIKNEVEQRLKRAIANIERGKKAPVQPEDNADQSPEEVRLKFDRIAASLMAYFKFQIDLGTIKASAFACLIHQAEKEIKIKQQMIKR